MGEGDREEGGSWLTEEAAERLGLAGLSEAALEAALGRLELSEGDLTEDALRCFRRDLQAGDLGRLVGGWDPWWRQSAARELRRGRLLQPGPPGARFIQARAEEWPESSLKTLLQKKR